MKTTTFSRQCNAGATRRPVWLFSMDSERFDAPPTTTAGLKAYFLARGRTASHTDIELVHFAHREEAARWWQENWDAFLRGRVSEARQAGQPPVFGFSCYTWNVAEFLDLARSMKAAVPEVLIIGGGPHVQRADDFLLDEPFDVIVLGEGEITFAELLDCGSPNEWQHVPGIAYVSPDNGHVHRPPPRPRVTELDRLPSPLGVLELRDAHGKAIYRQATYETSRGCPYRCAFCEWGTGAIGTKIHQFSPDRIRRDIERLVEGGIEDLWLADSNFGALREDPAKAKMIVDLHRRTGLPRTFATSWSKNPNRRVQSIVRLFHRHGMLSQYHLALQTLTPLALDLSHRRNMKANDYEPIVKRMAAEGIPVAAELIWGLPGDTLHEFAGHLDDLLAVFPNINIFGYTLLPGTEFFDRRRQYRMETLPVAGYGKAKGEYVVGCHTFSRDDGEEGYFLIAGHIVLVRGQIMPLAARFLALHRLPVSDLLRVALRAVLAEYGAGLDKLDAGDRMSVYENRAALYVHLLSRPMDLFATIRPAVRTWLDGHNCGSLFEQVERLLALDAALCPRGGETRTVTQVFHFAAHQAEERLRRMEIPTTELVENNAVVKLEIRHPGHVGDVLRDPDGAAWMRGQITRAIVGEP